MKEKKEQDKFEKEIEALSLLDLKADYKAQWLERVELVQAWTNRSTEENRKSRNRLARVWSVYAKVGGNRLYNKWRWSSQKSV